MTMAHHLAATAKSHSTDNFSRPKGILKNSNSYQTPGSARQTTTAILSPPATRPVDFKELTIQNTLQNAGRRRSSSTTPGSLSSPHRNASMTSPPGDDDTSSRLKWDEANLYLAEQEKTAKMKIDEPKTPYAPHYDPGQDEEDMALADAQESALLDAQNLVVDELDKSHTRPARGGLLEDDIPDLELGESEELAAAQLGDLHQELQQQEQRIFRERSLSNESHRSEKHVIVGANGVAGEDTEDHLMTTEEAKEKHREFEERRKKHYEMKNIKELLAHPETVAAMVDEDDDDDDDDSYRYENPNDGDDADGRNSAPAAAAHPHFPPVPGIPARFLNGGK